MINPQILNNSVDVIISEEACISLPDVYGNVKRHKLVVVEYTNLKGQKVKKKFKNFDATIVQHEIDHLNGKLIIDRMSMLTRLNFNLKST